MPIQEEPILDWRTKIVNPDGTPTDAFLMWAQTRLLQGNPGTTGDPGDPGIDAIMISASPNPVLVPCFYDGTPKISTPGFTLIVYQASSNITSLATYTVTGSTGVSGVSGVSGVYTVSGMTADTGYIDIEVSYGSATSTIRVSYIRTKDGTPAISGSGSVSEPSSNVTYDTVGSFNLKMGPNGNIDVNSNGSFDVLSGNINVDGYVEYSLDNVSWSTVTGSTFSGTAATSIDGGFWELTGAGMTGTSIGLSTNATVYFRMKMKKSNTNSFFNFSGSFSASWAG